MKLNDYLKIIAISVIEIAEQALESVEPGVTKHIEEEVIKQ